jgi:hypothetical protein
LCHAAANAIDADFGSEEGGARRISPFGGDQTYCASNTFGIWVVILGTDQAELQTEEFLIWFDGELLESTRTPWKKAPDPQGFWFG